MVQPPVEEQNGMSTRDTEELPIDALPKSRWQRSWPVIACGAGLFSDGYLNGVSHWPLLRRMYLSDKIRNCVNKSVRKMI